MKKRAKTSFSSNSRNILWALLIVAAAVTVYGIAQAASVSHTPADIQPQGAGSGLDSDLLQGLGSADILAQGGGGKELVTWGRASAFQGEALGQPFPATPAAGTGAPSCPAGWTQAYAGYGPYYSYAYDGSSHSGSLVCGTNVAQVVQSMGGGNYGIVEITACPFRNSDPTWGNNGAVSCNTCRVCVK